MVGDVYNPFVKNKEKIVAVGADSLKSLYHPTLLFTKVVIIQGYLQFTLTRRKRVRRRRRRAKPTTLTVIQFASSLLLPPSTSPSNKFGTNSIPSQNNLPQLSPFKSIKAHLSRSKHKPSLRGRSTIILSYHAQKTWVRKIDFEIENRSITYTYGIRISSYLFCCCLFF